MLKVITSTKTAGILCFQLIQITTHARNSVFFLHSIDFIFKVLVYILNFLYKMCYFNDKMWCTSINNNISLVRDVFGNLTLPTYIQINIIASTFICYLMYLRIVFILD